MSVVKHIMMKQKKSGAFRHNVLFVSSRTIRPNEGHSLMMLIYKPSDANQLTKVSCRSFPSAICVKVPFG